MFFLVDDKKKFLIGWSAKCACTSVKKWFIEACRVKIPKDKKVHTVLGYGQTRWSCIKGRTSPGFPDKYKKFIVVRDPYKRLVSGYLDKIIIHPVKKKYPWENFEEFVYFLEEDPKFKTVDAHHFIPQTRESFRLIGKTNSAWDLVLNVDNLHEDFHRLNVILDINVSIPLCNEIQWGSKGPFAKPAYQMDADELKRCTPCYNLFYNEPILKIVKKYYSEDFKLLKYNNVRAPRPI